jgi:hypothetical protein
MFRSRTLQYPIFASNNNEDHKAIYLDQSEANKKDATVPPKPKKEVSDPPRFLGTGYDIAALLNVMTALALIYNYPSQASHSARIVSATAATATNLVTR